MLSPMAPSFSGKLPNTTINWWHRGSLEGPEPLAQSATYKSRKYNLDCATVGFRTLAAANPSCARAFPPELCVRRDIKSRRLASSVAWDWPATAVTRSRVARSVRQGLAGSRRPGT